MYAVIETGSKQYRVQPGDVITVEKLNAEVGDEIKLDKVLVMGEGENAEVGTPYLDAAVTAKVVENGKGKKVIIYKYKAKKDYRRKNGHRQPYTLVKVTGIGASAKKAEKAAKAEEPAKEEKAAPKVSASMKKDELLAVAKEMGVEVDAKATKADIIAAIEAK